MKSIMICSLSLICIFISGCAGLFQDDVVFQGEAGTLQSSSNMPQETSSNVQSTTTQDIAALDLMKPNEAMLFFEAVLSEIETNEGWRSLDLMKPNEAMLFFEAVLSEIETNEGWRSNDIIKYSNEYSMEYKKHTDGDFVVFTAENGPTTLLYVIVDIDTKKFRYFEAPKDLKMYTFDYKQAEFACRSGETAMHFPNFPYSMTYQFDKREWDKVHLPINDDHSYYKLGGHPASFGSLTRIEMVDSAANLIFKFDEFLNDESVDSGLPICHYWFDPIDNIATLSFSGIVFTDADIATQLENISGISNAQIVETDAIDLNAKKDGITQASQITFNVSDEYNLYGEYRNTAWYPDAIENNEMSFLLWTEKK